MKNCNEMVNSLIARREKYETEKKQRRKKLTRTLTPICCVCIAVLLGFGAWQGGLLQKQPTQTLEDAIYPGIKDHFDEKNGEDPDNPQANNKIVINEIDSVPANRHNIALMIDDFVKMSKDEANEYYGIDIFPTVPTDLKEWDDSVYGIYCRDGGKGEVYWDQMVLNYSNEDVSRIVNMEIKKGSLPFLDYGFGDTEEEKSIVNNWEVTIGYSKASGYHAFFMYKDVGFCVNVDGLTQDEFVSVLSSIIK